jgi:hypothetical protein
MPVSRRYNPEWAPGESGMIGYDFSPIIPVGVGIAGASLEISTNVADPQTSTDFTIGTVLAHGRAVYAMLSGGVLGTDYQLHWYATDTDGNFWPRTALLLCSFTS